MRTALTRLLLCAILSTAVSAWAAPPPPPAKKDEKKKDDKGGMAEERTVLGPWALSLKIGLGFSSTSSTTTGLAHTSSNSSMGLGFGAGVDWDFWPGVVGFRSEVLWIGRKSVQSELSTEAAFKYIHVPIMARYRNGVFMVMAGPYFAYNIGGVTDETGTDVSDLWGKMDYGLTFGVGIIWPIGEFFAPFGELRYNWGWANISGVDGTTTRWRCFDFVIGAQF